MMENNCVNLYWNSLKIEEVMVRMKIWFSSATLISTWTNASNGTSTGDEEQLCQIILNPSTIVEFIIRTDAHTHVHTHIQLGNIQQFYSFESDKFSVDFYPQMKF